MNNDVDPNTDEHNDSILRCIRIAKGISADVIAEKSGVSKQLLYRLERHYVVKDTNINKISAALEIDPEIVYYNMGRIPPNKIKFFKKDPLFFMRLINEVCENPEQFFQTSNFINSLEQKIDEIKTAEEKIMREGIDTILNKK